MNELSATGDMPLRGGLSPEEAARRLADEGPNALPQSDRRSAFRLIFEVLREPMLALLLVAGGAYLVLGDRTEALILLAFATFSVVVTVIQETRTEHVLEKLRDLSAPRALVIRGGERIRIAGREVVRGDVLILEQGDRVAADAVLLDAQDLQIDESLLTGESLPVPKCAASDEVAAIQPRPGGENQPYIFSGSLVVRGEGLARTISTGPNTEIGKIGQSLAALDNEPSRLHAETGAIVRFCGLGGVGVALVVVLLYGLSRGAWLDALLAGIAISMAMLPEEFPVVLTIFLAMGAWRIARVGVLTRRAAAIETLGSATVLCTDKTGTLTENRMAIAQLWLPTGQFWTVDTALQVPPEFTELIDAGRLASAVEAVDPMDQAFHAAANVQDALRENKELSGRRLLHRYGLTPDLLAMSNVWEPEPGSADFIIAAKGAPEAIAELCRLSEADHRRLIEAVDRIAEGGMRILAVAIGRESGDPHRPSQRHYAFTLAGLVAMADPLRASVPAAIAECKSAGIRVVMITGDYPATARSIASQAGIDAAEVLTGADLDSLDDEALRERLKSTTIFARIMPEQKLRIVQAYKEAGEVVAMTGDGVNDAPSLKAAHIGVAMGKRGTDVAREASAIVLLNDDFGAIVHAVRLGRRIYDNIRKAMSFIFAVHVPIAGLAVLPLLFGFPVLLGPIHIALLEMVIDPVCALVFEAEREEADVMNQPPRAPQARLLSLQTILWSVFQGGIVFAMLALIWFVGKEMPETELRALLFFALVAAILSLTFANRSFSSSMREALFRPNKALGVVLVVVTFTLLLILVLPDVRLLLRFGPLHYDDLLIVGAVALLILWVIELLKPLWQDRRAIGATKAASDM